MVLIPQNEYLQHILNNSHVKNNPRVYLGLSGIGEKCYRKLQHDHYLTYDSWISRRISRIFSLGHMMESQVYADLEFAGFTIVEIQPKMVGTAGHWRGHADAIIEKDGRQFLLEIKTHNDASYKALVKHGVKKSKPGHYAQTQAYMGYLKLDCCLYIAYNKDTSEYYVEFVDFDHNHFEESRRKEFEVIASDTLLPRIGNNSPSWYECKMCSANAVCFGKEPVKVTCRTCKNVVCKDDGVWSCSLTFFNLDVADQYAACDEYQMDEMFK